MKGRQNPKTIKGMTGLEASGLMSLGIQVTNILVNFFVIAVTFIPDPTPQNQAKGKLEERPCTRLTRDFDSRLDGQPLSHTSFGLHFIRGSRCHRRCNLETNKGLRPQATRIDVC